MNNTQNQNEEAKIYSGLLSKAIADAVKTEKSATNKWHNAGQVAKAYYADRSAMEADKEVVCGFIISAFSKAEQKTLNATFERDDKSPETLVLKAVKKNLQTKISVYWSRLLNYAFPPEKVSRAPQQANAESAESAESEAPSEKVSTTPEKAPSEAKTESMADAISAMIEKLQKMENPPSGVDVPQAIKHLNLAKSFLRGI